MEVNDYIILSSAYVILNFLKKKYTLNQNKFC